MLISGTQVIARGLRWSIVHGQPAGDETLYRLRALEGELAGSEIDLLEPFEELRPIVTHLQPEKPGSLARWRVYHEAFLLEQALGSKALLAAQPGRLSLEPYQLVPVMRALQMSRPRLLLADGVGLGKTIQAGLVISELLARRRAHRILLVTPPGPLLRQWQKEMRDRFGLRFTVLDRAQLQENRARMELGANPFDLDSLGLISVDFAKQEKVLQEIEKAHYDIIVIDECHHCMSLGQTADQEDSLRRRLAEVLAARCDTLILASATPHDGYDPHFASLVQLLDPSLVDGRGALRGEAFKRHVIRRLKNHVPGKFKDRKVHPIRVDPGDPPAYAAFQQALLGLVAPLLRRAKRRRRYSDVLAFLSLLKRSVSSATACRLTLERIHANLTERINAGGEDQESRLQRLRSLRDLQKKLERFGVLSYEEEQDQLDLEAEDMATELFENGPEAMEEALTEAQKEVRRERDRLRALKETQEALVGVIGLAKKAEAEDPKFARILTEIEAIRAAEPRTNILVYTEYSDSQDALVSFLNQKSQRPKITGEVLQLSGRDDEDRRAEYAQKFEKEDNLLLISTDATAEGLNLHHRCHHLIHLELPYNPNRLEQRNGRIDRYGQTNDPQVRYLYLGNSFEERILARLVAKFETQRTRLTFMPDTLGNVALNQQGGIGMRLLDGLAEEDHNLFQNADRFLDWESAQDEPVDTPAYQELLEEIDRAISGFEKSMKAQSWLAESGLNAEKSKMDQAAEAQEQSKVLGVSDLLRFVCEALRADVGDGKAAQEIEHGIWRLKLPHHWCGDLGKLPGFDEGERTMLITDQLTIEETSKEEPVGFLGRAHPLVRRAIERTRHIQYRSGSEDLDARVAAAAYDGNQPALLYTYLGRLQSEAGPEYERLLTVLCDADGNARLLESTDEWLALADPLKGIPTRDLWKNTFASLAPKAEAAGKRLVVDHFDKASSAFLQEHRALLNAELADLDAWLRTRADEICGAAVTTTADLFEQDKNLGPDWRRLAEPRARLSGFANDDQQPSRARAEASTVLELYKNRSADIAKRRKTKPFEVTAVGLLMLVPKGAV